MKKLLLIGIPVIALIGFLLSGYVLAPSDEQMIQRAIDESTAAAREGKPSEVLDHLSNSFTVSEQSASPFDISKLIKLSKPKIVVLDPRAQINGETATVISPVDVEIDYMDFKLDHTLPKVTIQLKKEMGFKFLIVPEPRWRITSVNADGLPTEI